MNPKSCDIDLPAFNNPPHTLPMPILNKRMTQDQIAEFGKWLKENEPICENSKSCGQYLELFAYRIVAKLGV